MAADFQWRIMNSFTQSSSLIRRTHRKNAA